MVNDQSIREPSQVWEKEIKKVFTTIKKVEVRNRSNMSNKFIEKNVLSQETPEFMLYKEVPRKHKKYVEGSKILFIR